MTTTFRVHVHRLALHSADPLKWYVHLDAWGPDPIAFRDVRIEVPCRTAYGGLADQNAVGVTQVEPCGCANAWLEGEVELNDWRYEDDGAVFVIGSK